MKIKTFRFRLQLIALAFSIGGLGFASCKVDAQDSKQPIRWKMYSINDQSPFEACGAADFNGDGKVDIFCGDSWYEAPKWTKHKVRDVAASTNPHYHEDFCDSPLDVNGDGRIDIITPKGWYERPADASSDAWSFHPEFELGATGIFIHGRDVDGDKLTDIVWGMGHGFGLNWLKQSVSADGKRAWEKFEIDGTFSQVHTLMFANLDGEGEPELITGKRVYAHEVEPGDTQSPVVFTFQYNRTSGKWRKETIFRGEPAPNAPPKAQDRWALKDFPRGSAGTGLQMAAVDFDGDGDIDLVCPGKSGLYLFENLGRP